MPAAPATVAPETSALPSGPERTWQVETPLYRTSISNRGAALVGWELRQFHEGSRRNFAPVRLLMAGEEQPARVRTPLRELRVGDLGDAVFEVEQAGPLEFSFSLSHAGLVVRKRYEFAEDDYRFQLWLEIENRTSSQLEPAFGVEWEVGQQSGPDFTELGLAALHQDGLTQHLLGSLGVAGFFSAAQPEVALSGGIDWAGQQTPYFLGAFAPDHAGRATALFRALEPGERAAVSVGFEPVALPPGARVAQEFRGYFGPKEEERLLAAGSELSRSIDLGWRWVEPLTHFFGWLLSALYALVPNYGVAIILVTVLVRVATLPLTNRQMRSMERMRALAPKQKELQEKFANDRQKQSEAMMELYRREKVNPIGGCLPMLLQLPVFVGLYYALRGSIHLRQAPFVGWIDDLSIPEQLFVLPGLDLPVRVLPLLMGASMVVQQKLTPMGSMDPAQARMMLILMPVMMTFMFYQFPSGLVLYWMVSNVLAIAHQRWIGSRLK